MQFSAFSKGAHSTWNHFKNLRLLIDAGEGVATRLEIGDVSALRTVLLTHAHFDHVAGLPMLIHLRSRFPDLPLLKIYHANPCLRLRLIDLMVNPNGTRPLAEFIEVRPGEKIVLGGSNPAHRWAEALEVLHDVGDSKNAVGYKLFESRKRLNPALVGHSQQEIAVLARADPDQVNITEDVHLLTYTGDTRPLPIEAYGRPKLLMHDATYPLPDMDKAGHDHSSYADAAKAAAEIGCALAVNHLSLRWRDLWKGQPEFGRGNMRIEGEVQIVRPSDEPTVITIPS